VWKIRGWKKKYVLRRFAYDKLPRKITRGPKKGFESPVGFWFQGPLGEALIGKLHESPLKKCLKTEFVEQILQDHRKKKRDASKQLLGLYTLVQWIDVSKVTLP
jgi:asparagine synthase (glutamine-hydrolysing)